MNPDLINTLQQTFESIGKFFVAATALFWAIKPIADKVSADMSPGWFGRWVKSLANIASPFAIGGKPIRQSIAMQPPEGTEIVQLQNGDRAIVPSNSIIPTISLAQAAAVLSVTTKPDQTDLQESPKVSSEEATKPE